MSDIATLTKQAHDTGYDKGYDAGSIAACNAILAFLNSTGLSIVAVQVLTAWEDGTITSAPVEDPVTPTDPAPQPPAIVLPAPKMSREQARGSGYTGDSCTYCQGLQVKRNGSCLVCETCGNTTGCS